MEAGPAAETGGLLVFSRCCFALFSSFTFWSHSFSFRSVVSSASSREALDDEDEEFKNEFEEKLKE